MAEGKVRPLRGPQGGQLVRPETVQVLDAVALLQVAVTGPVLGAVQDGEACAQHAEKGWSPDSAGSGGTAAEMLCHVANHHFGKFADVWKHLALVTVLTLERPSHYAETHAGLAANPMVDDAERRFGVFRFLEVADDNEILARSRYRTLLTELGDPRGFYPGSALLALAELGDGTSYLLCDLDPVSVADLREWSMRTSVRRCRVVQGDGMGAAAEWLREQIPNGAEGRAMVHIDPFDPYAHLGGNPSALELAAQLTDGGYGLVYWYGYDRPDRARWAYDTLCAATQGPLWCGDVLLTDETGSGESGDLGRATTPGTGCGVVLANVSTETVTACTTLGRALATAYARSTLPDGTACQVRFTLRQRR